MRSAGSQRVAGLPVRLQPPPSHLLEVRASTSGKCCACEIPPSQRSVPIREQPRYLTAREQPEARHRVREGSAPSTTRNPAPCRCNPTFAYSQISKSLPRQVRTPGSLRDLRDLDFSIMPPLYSGIDISKDIGLGPDASFDRSVMIVWTVCCVAPSLLQSPHRSSFRNLSIFIKTRTLRALHASSRREGALVRRQSTPHE